MELAVAIQKVVPEFTVTYEPDSRQEIGKKLIIMWDIFMDFSQKCEPLGNDVIELRDSKWDERREYYKKWNRLEIQKQLRTPSPCIFSYSGYLLEHGLY